jgi:hypothetical protein
MFTRKILAAFILAGLAGVAIVGDATAQSSKVLICQQECAGNPVCLQACGSTEGKRKRTRVRPPEPPQTPPPTVKSWRDDLFDSGKDGGGGGGGGGGGR